MKSFALLTMKSETSFRWNQIRQASDEVGFHHEVISSTQVDLFRQNDGFNWKKHRCCDAFFWWAGVDSNHRSRRRQIYSLLPLATREPTHIDFFQ